MERELLISSSPLPGDQRWDTRDGLKLHQGKFRPGIKIFTGRVVSHWISKVIMEPSLPEFKDYLDRTLSHVV